MKAKTPAKPRKKFASERERADAQRATVAASVRRLKAARIDIEIPEWTEPSARRAKCAKSLTLFMQTYLPRRFPLPFSKDHERGIARMEGAVLYGGKDEDSSSLFAQAAPRGDGKTERTVACVLWATLYSHRRFVPVIASDLNAAKSIVAEISSELSDNDLIAEDWPQVCVPMQEVAASPNRARFLTHQGEPIHLESKTTKLVLATPLSAVTDPACGAVIVPRGITSSLRGMRHKTVDGKTIRPDFAIIDDPQTDEAAHSPEQCNTREALVNAAIMGLAGPSKKIAAIANMTIIRHGDLAYRLLDTSLHPEWNGERYAMVYRWPDAKDTLWKEYEQLRRNGRGNHAECNAFYLANRAEMDKGAEVSWEHRKREGESSALQCAFNLLIDHGEQAFFAEYQNDPKPAIAIGWEIDQQTVMKHLSGVPRGKVPDACELLIFSSDVNVSVGLNWTVTAWTPDGVGYVVDWGRWPAVDAPLWEAGKSAVTEEQAIFMAIIQCAKEITARPYTRMESGERVLFSGIGFDCRYKPSAVTKAVAEIRKLMPAVQCMPVLGLSGRHYRAPKDARRGDGWHNGTVKMSRALFINSDIMRERMQKSFLLPVGSPGGSLSLYGDDPKAHEVLADHATAERITDVLTGEKLGTMYAWTLVPGRRNDLGDALCYGIAVAAFLGVQFGNTSIGLANAKPKRVLPAQPEPNPAKPVVNPLMQRAVHRVPRRSGGGWVNAW